VTFKSSWSLHGDRLRRSATMTWLILMEYLCHKWPCICSTFNKHFPVLSIFMHNFKVSIRLQDNTKAMKQINSDVFVGVSPRKRSAIFYLSWINNKSTVVLNQIRFIHCSPDLELVNVCWSTISILSQELINKTLWHLNRHELSTGIDSVDLPQRSAIFYLSWINNKSTRSGILQFLELKDDNKFFSCTSVCKVEYTGGVW
jgi:hypothetical protein